MKNLRNEKIVIIVLCAIVAIIILSLIIAFSIIHADKMDAIKQAVLEDCLDEANEDYIMHIEKCKARSSNFKGAEFYLVWMYTDEDGLEVMFVRYYQGVAEVFEQ